MNKEETKEVKKEPKKEKKDNKNQKLLEQINELEDKILREKAELINYRKRKDEEVSSMLRYANEDIIKELLPIVDNFESAIKLDDNDLHVSY